MSEDVPTVVVGWDLDVEVHGYLGGDGYFLGFGRIEIDDWFAAAASMMVVCFFKYNISVPIIFDEEEWRFFGIGCKVRYAIGGIVGASTIIYSIGVDCFEGGVIGIREGIYS